MAADKKVIVETVVAISEKLLSNDKVKSMVLGTYSDGTPRSIPDAINNELYSPKQKKKAIKRNEKRKKKKKQSKLKL